jgi:hypothetical protein
MQRRLIVIACVLDVLAAALLLLGGAAVIFWSASGLRQAGAREEFAGAMLVGNVGLMLLILAACFALHAWWCRRRLRLFAEGRTLQWHGFVLLALGPIAALGLFFKVGSRLIG